MKESSKTVLYLLAVIWLVAIINLITGNALFIYGILPRNISGLRGILLHPFIHGSLQHIISNSIPLLVLGFLISREGTAQFLKVTFSIILLGGMLLWLLGRESYHIGASLLIFGYFGYIILNAFYRKTSLTIITALITVFLYGGTLYGLLPLDNRVSWEGHLFGLIAGVITARLFRY